MEERREGFCKIINECICSTITVTNTLYLDKLEADPWDVLQALKQKPAPSDMEQHWEVRGSIAWSIYAVFSWSPALVLSSLFCASMLPKSATLPCPVMSNTPISAFHTLANQFLNSTASSESTPYTCSGLFGSMSLIGTDTALESLLISPPPKPSASPTEASTWNSPPQTSPPAPSPLHPARHATRASHRAYTPASPSSSSWRAPPV